jgi:hypothetical protein
MQAPAQGRIRRSVEHAPMPRPTPLFHCRKKAHAAGSLEKHSLKHANKLVTVPPSMTGGDMHSTPDMQR